MNKTAIVMSVNEHEAVILAPGGRFHKIKNRNFHIGQRIILEPKLFSLSDRLSFAVEDVKERVSHIIQALRYKGMIIAGAAILIPTTAYAGTKYIPWTCVSLDRGNISIQYNLNALGEVLSTEPLSPEAEGLVDSMERVGFEKIERAMERTLDEIDKNRTPSNENGEEITIGISTRFGGGERTANTITEAFSQREPENFNIEHIKWSEIQDAHSQDLSIGQYGRKYNPPEQQEEQMPGNEMEQRPEQNVRPDGGKDNNTGNGVSDGQGVSGASDVNNERPSMYEHGEEQPGQLSNGADSNEKPSTNGQKEEQPGLYSNWADNNGNSLINEQGENQPGKPSDSAYDDSVPDNKPSNDQTEDKAPVPGQEIFPGESAGDTGSFTPDVSFQPEQKQQDESFEPGMTGSEAYETDHQEQQSPGGEHQNPPEQDERGGSLHSDPHGQSGPQGGGNPPR